MRIGEIGVIGEGELIVEGIVRFLVASVASLADVSAEAAKARLFNKPANANPFTIGVNFIGILINGMVHSVLPI